MISFNIDELIPYIKKDEPEIGMGELTFLLSGELSPDVASVIYSNRGVTRWMSGEIDEAFQDFQKSLSINHLNYISYFNLYSLYSFANQNEQALDNLCCTISCLLLLRGRKNSNQDDILEAIRYSQNNIEARLHQGLFYLKNGENQKAMNEINWVLQFEPTNIKFQTIREKIAKLISKNPAQNECDEAPNCQCPTLETNSRRLKSSYYSHRPNFPLNTKEELKIKLNLFNELYLELNEEDHSIVQENPPIYLLYRRIAKNPENASVEGGQSQKCQNLDRKEQTIEKVQSHLPICEERLPEVIEPAHNENNEDHQNQQLEQICDTQSKDLEGEGEDMESGINDTYIYQSPPKKVSSFSHNSEYRDNSSSYTLRTPEEEKNLSIRIHRVEITNLPEDDLKKIQNLFCQFRYGHRKFESRNLSRDKLKQNFDDSFEVELEDSPQFLKLQVFNKQSNGEETTLLGEGQKEITMVGRIEIGLGIGQAATNAGKVFLDIRYK